jgi:hypothetical protein
MAASIEFVIGAWKCSGMTETFESTAMGLGNVECQNIWSFGYFVFLGCDVWGE